MFELLYRVFIGHNHKWTQVETIMRAPRKIGGPAAGKVYILKYEICGKHKQVDFN